MLSPEQVCIARFWIKRLKSETEIYGVANQCSAKYQCVWVCACACVYA